MPAVRTVSSPAGGGPTALVLSGGGARGAYHAGVLRALLERGALAEVGLISGTSIGALHAAVLAEAIEQGDLPEALRRLEAAWLQGVDITRPNWSGLVAALVGIVVLRPRSRGLRLLRSVLAPGPARQMIASLIPPRRRLGEYRRVELMVTATDLNAGRESYFAGALTPEVPVLSAVLASVALPVLLPSEPIQDHWYVDGGFFDNTPLGEVIRRGAARIIVVSTQPECGRPGPAPESGPLPDVGSVARRIWAIALDRLLYEDMRQALRTNRLLELIDQAPDPDSPWVRQLREAIGYTSGGRRKHKVEILQICPSVELTPPGTLGFADREALRRTLQQGYQDGLRALPAWPPGPSPSHGPMAAMAAPTPLPSATGRPRSASVRSSTASWAAR